ncbi:MAG: Flp family type IVb pilin [Vulcanimicrobiaceae bacterium]
MTSSVSISQRGSDVVAAARRLAHDEEGATLVEYALIVALIAVVAIAAVTLLGKNASSSLNKAAISV